MGRKKSEIVRGELVSRDRSARAKAVMRAFLVRRTPER
jgi:hypothetical protein